MEKEQSKQETRKIESLQDFHKLTHGERWWDLGPWKGPRKVMEVSSPDSLFRAQDPDCKHNRCAQTQIECEACTAYSKTYLEEWRKEKAKNVK